MLNVTIHPQHDGVSCGPTCLHALYRYFGDTIQLHQTMAEVPYLETGGTLAVLLGCHALKQGYHATLHSFNLQVNDPSWFNHNSGHLIDKLRIQLLRATDTKTLNTTQAYIHFLEMGGVIHFSDVTFDVIRGYIDKGIPLLSGVSGTWLYQNMRDYTSDDNKVVYDEWIGAPTGHFVVIRGYEAANETLHLADPYTPHPLSDGHYYQTSFSHWLHAHLLGIISYDAELLAITPTLARVSGPTNHLILFVQPPRLLLLMYKLNHNSNKQHATK